MENTYVFILPLFQVCNNGVSENFTTTWLLSFPFCHESTICVSSDKKTDTVQGRNKSFSFLLPVEDAFNFPGTVFSICDRKSITNLSSIEFKLNEKSIENRKKKSLCMC